jgi:hypothetical protein
MSKNIHSREYKDYLRAISKEVKLSRKTNAHNNRHRNKQGLGPKSTPRPTIASCKVAGCFVAVILVIQVINWSLSLKLSQESSALLETERHSSGSEFQTGSKVYPYKSFVPFIPSDFHHNQENGATLAVAAKYIDPPLPQNMSSSASSNHHKWYVWGDDKLGLKTLNLSLADLYNYDPANTNMNHKPVCVRPVFVDGVDHYKFNNSLWRMHIKTMGDVDELFSQYMDDGDDNDAVAPAGDDFKKLESELLSFKTIDPVTVATPPKVVVKSPASLRADLNRQYQRIMNAKMYMSVRLNGLPLSGLYSAEFIVSEVCSPLFLLLSVFSFCLFSQC